MDISHTVICVALVLFQCVNGKSKPNIIFILTDDQDVLLNSMAAMRNVRELIANKGVTFQNAFVNSPICCPSRSTILTGKHVHNTGVRNNSIEGNCSSTEWQKHHEPYSFVSLLHDANYSTFHAGKYLNTYGDKECGGVRHKPKGYDWWLGLKGNSKYYNYTLSINGTAQKFTDQYLTDVMKMYALSFLNEQQTNPNPFFMMLATPASHSPFTPAQRHRTKFPAVKALRTPSFNYSEYNRHWLLRLPPLYLPTDVSVLDNIQRHRFQTLLAVDEMVSEIIYKLKSMSILKDTYIIFTSDNGYHIGQFVQPWDKRQPYETDIRVPFMIRGPLIKPKQISDLVISAVDIAPTILSMAGFKIPEDIDGRSFHKRMINNAPMQEHNILIEYYGEGNTQSVDPRCPWFYDANLSQCRIDNWCKCEDSRNNTFVCVRRLSRTTDFKFCQFFDEDNFMEAYDLLSDKHELHNVYDKMNKNQVQDYIITLQKLRNCVGSQCYL